MKLKKAESIVAVGCMWAGLWGYVIEPGPAWGAAAIGTAATQGSFRVDGSTVSGNATFCSGHWTNQLYQFEDSGVEELRGMFGGITFPFVHDWSYRGTLCAELEKPFLPVQPATLYEHGTGKKDQVNTAIRKIDDSGLLTRDQVTGCKSITPEVIVYDRPKLREIAFPNLFDTYSAELAGRIWRAGAQVQLRGIDRRMGGGDCSVNLMWAE